MKKEDEVVFVKKSYGYKLYGQGINENGYKILSYVGRIRYSEMSDRYLYIQSFFTMIGEIGLFQIAEKLKSLNGGK